jgi:DNA-binding MarR family transcriptional regulator
MTQSNHPLAPNHRQPAIERALETFEAFQQRLMSIHAADFAALDVTMAQAKLLYVVAAAGELTMSEVAQRVGVSISTASAAVDRLVATGLLARSEDPSNRRQVRVSITATGIENLEQLRELSLRQMRELLERVPDADLGVIEHATRILMAAIEAAPDSHANDPAATQPPGAPR